MDALDAHPAAGSEASEETLPFSRLLVVHDGALPSQHGGAWALLLARPRRARVTILTPRPPPAFAARLDRARRRGLDSLERRLTRENLPYDTIEVTGDATSETLRAAQMSRADLVLMGANVHSNIRQLSDRARRVFESTHASTFIARGAPPPARILSGADGSPHGKAAVEVALALARHTGAVADVLHVAATAQKTPEEAFSGGSVRTLVAAGDPAEEILRHAAATASNLIVIGCRGQTSPRRRDPGSVCAKVAADARTSVLILRGETT